MDEQIVIFKNEKTGDLIHSVSSIKEIISKNKNTKVNIFLSHYNSEMKFLFTNHNVIFHIITEKINLKDKIKVFIFFLKNKIKETYIFKPSFFLFLLPLFFKFKVVKFYGICVNNNNYHRPPLILRNLLERFVINDRGTKKIRKSINDLHLNLVLNNDKSNYNLATLNKKNLVNVYIKNYIFIHFNKFKFNKLNWDLNYFFRIVDELNTISTNIVITNDLNDIETNNLIQKKYSDSSSKGIYYYPNAKGEFFFNLIGNAKLIVAFHGMITSIGAIQKVKVLDLFNCDIKNKDDFYRYKNAFHEFKPKLSNYEFLIPKKDFNNTLKKIKKLIKNGRKINN